MGRILNLLYVIKILQQDLKDMDGKELSEVNRIVAEKGYTFLNFNSGFITRNPNCFKEIVPYIGSSIKVNPQVRVDINRIKRDFSIPSQYIFSDYEIVDKNVVLTFGLNLFSIQEGVKAKLLLNIPMKIMNKNYLITDYEAIRGVYVHKIDFWKDAAIVNHKLLPNGKGNTKDKLHYYKFNEEMYNRVLPLLDSNLCLPFVDDENNGLFYELEQD